MSKAQSYWGCFDSALAELDGDAILDECRMKSTPGTTRILKYEISYFHKAVLMALNNIIMQLLVN